MCRPRPATSWLGSCGPRRLLPGRGVRTLVLALSGAWASRSLWNDRKRCDDDRVACFCPEKHAGLWSISVARACFPERKHATRIGNHATRRGPPESQHPARRTPPPIVPLTCLQASATRPCAGASPRGLDHATRRHRATMLGFRAERRAERRNVTHDTRHDGLPPEDGPSWHGSGP